ncbi:carbohydrate-binding protein [Myceligenerans pegani]|uniref:Right-handed parallel beta-helix repeat-containing protein n=1 Tax=Myceligenerans pegani TaxID=2776917 RepID=A0ABR9N4V7_9MICO|nr:carbohydrate-binding protein [Myceligenerans sp. TRM 65318]MBE1878699.1 right-handed parallel beta-helix repeat-containing protein [Myceligenerans sp. TRM 65318]MBE3020970.1 right-handed parallel beta-helix repeat-containing protein [Myceligenerans sp. TRM 65318]
MSRTRVGPRPLFTAVAASALVLAGLTVPAVADPASALVADDLNPGSITTADVVAGAFAIMASEAKAVTVDSADRTSDRGDVYTQRLKLNGSGSAAERSLRFDATAGTEVTVHARSGSGTADRALALYDTSWTEVDRVVAAADDDSAPIATEVLTVPADGTYWLASPSSGVNVFYAELDVAPDTGRTPWSEVAAPVVDQVVAGPGAPGSLLVGYTGTVGPDGADLAHAYLYDVDGNVVDRAFTAADGATGTLAVEPPSSGSYAVEVLLTRAGEDAPLVSERVATPEFSLPLATPEISGILTTAVSGAAGTVTVEWGAVAEAETYSIGLRQGTEEFTTVVDGVTGTTADVTGLTVGQTYEARVVAHRGGDAATSAPVEFTVSDAVERWQTAHVGVGSGGEVIENEDGSITFDALGNSGKAADSEDGFWYHYTAIDPATENFTLRATIHVDDSASKDNQSGFGIVAVDDLIPNDSSARYMNSAGASVAKYLFGAGGEEGVRYGTPGAKFVHGYTGPPTESSASRDMTDSRAFDWDYKDGYEEGGNANPPRFEAGEDYELTLRRSNTGFHAIWHRDGEQSHEVIQYDPDMLLTQNDEVFYVGLFAARKIKVTVTDWSFETIHPDDDEPAQEPPPVYVTPELAADVTRTTPHDSIDVPLTSNVYGTARVTDADGAVVADGLDVVPGERTVVPLDLARGTNEFTARLVPAADQPHFGEREELESTDPVEIGLSFDARAYNEPGQAIRVAPDGDAGGDGTSDAPLDLHTAVAYAQPGQQIVLEGGTYLPQEAIVIERGRNGTADAPITLMSEPGSRAVLDLSESESGGIWLRGDHWHLYDLEITRSQGYKKPLHIGGHHNVIEKIESHHNQDSGIQISGLSAEPPEMWPSHNLVVSSEAHNNRDPLGNDADGFGVKLTAGEGNVIRYSIAHHNIDDGWDLYAKSTTGPIGVVTVEDSVAYANGWLEDDENLTDLGEGNGFKLGGESMPGAHVLRNSVSFGNLAKGVTSNSGPDVRLENVTSVGNGMVSPSRSAMNVQLKTAASETDYRASGVLSWQATLADELELKQDDTSLLTDPTNYFDGVAAAPGDGPAAVTEDWFVSTDAVNLRPEIGPDGSVVMHGLYELTDVAPSGTGARLAGNPDPTVIEPLPEVVPVAPWYPTTIYTAGDVVAYDGVAYEARWWTRGTTPVDGSWWGPWVAVGPAAMPPVEECATPWSADAVYTRDVVVSHDGVNHVAYWWTRGLEPGTSVHGAWGAVAPCR